MTEDRLYDTECGLRRCKNDSSHPINFLPLSRLFSFRELLRLGFFSYSAMHLSHLHPAGKM